MAFLLATIGCISGCNKLVDVDTPTNMIDVKDVFTADATAISALNGIYSTMSSNSNGPGMVNSWDITAMSAYLGLAADELILFTPTSDNHTVFYTNDFTPNMNNMYWESGFRYIYYANSSIEGIMSSTTLTPSIKKQLLGEAKFVRAFFYFYLANLFGDLPLVLTTNYKINEALYRSPMDEVWKQIVGDLKEAKSSLGTIYPNGTFTASSEDRVRPTKWAAAALLARSYLYMEQWELAEKEADSIINESSLFSLSSLENAFLMSRSGNKEAIWQIQSVGTGAASNTGEGYDYILPNTGPSTDYPVYLSDTVVNNLEANDKRKTIWCNYVTVDGTKYYYAYKYKIGREITETSEHLMVLRLGEQYLIRAEARAHLDKLSEAAADLNVIRNRAGLGPTPATQQESILVAIAHERQAELFLEWGHRWFDLKRTGKIDEVMNKVTPLKGGTWKSAFQYLPISDGERQKGFNLTQTPGY